MNGNIPALVLASSLSWDLACSTTAPNSMNVPSGPGLDTPYLVMAAEKLLHPGLYLPGE
jgi:hypothetical protein